MLRPHLEVKQESPVHFSPCEFPAVLAKLEVVFQPVQNLVLTHGMNDGGQFKHSTGFPVDYSILSRSSHSRYEQLLK